MKRPKIYREIVKTLPVSSKFKNWLMGNWIGGLIGIVGALFLASGFVGIGGTGATFSFQRFIDYPVATSIFIIVGFLIGTFIQSLLRGK